MPHRSIDIPADTPVEEHEDAPEFERAVKHAREFMQKGDYEFPYTMLHYLRRKTPEHLDAAARDLIPTMLADAERSDFDAYSSLSDSTTVRKKYITRDYDASLRYKFDLVKSLQLSPETQDDIAFRSLVAVLQQLDVKIREGQVYHGFSSSFSSERYPLENGVRRACEVLYQLPFQNKDLLLPLQQKYRDFAPHLLARAGSNSGVYYLQELGIALRLPWHTELEKIHGPAAIDLLMQAFEHTDDYYKGHCIENVLYLQEYCHAPITPLRKQKAVEMLSRCIGYSDDTAEKMIAAFDIDSATVSAIAREQAVDYMQRHENVAPQDRSSWFPAKLALAYGVQLQDLPLVERTRVRCVQDVLSKPSPTEQSAAAVAFVEQATRDHTAYLLPLALAAEMHRAMGAQHENIMTPLLHAFSKPPAVKEHLSRAMGLLFADRRPEQLPTLNLHQEGNRLLWRELVADGDCVPAAEKALDQFLVGAGLHPEHTRAMWQLSSNDTREYCKRMGTRETQLSNIAAIAKLEAQSPGATRYFANRWNMQMFSRYPTDVLSHIKANEELDRQDLGKPRKKQKTLLIIYPAADWNGAFSNKSLIADVAAGAQAKGFTMHIAEAKSRMSAIRALAKCARQHGQIDVCIFGGHASKDSLTLGPDELGKMQTEHFAFAKDEDGQPVPGEQLKRLRNYCSPDCRFIFKACSVGQEGGLAQVVSQSMNVTTVGADAPAGIRKIDLATGKPHYFDSARACEYVQPRPPPRTFLQRLWQRLRRKKDS